MGGDQMISGRCDCGIGLQVTPEYWRMSGGVCPRCLGLMDTVEMVAPASAGKNGDLHGFSRLPMDQLDKVQEELDELAMAIADMEAGEPGAEDDVAEEAGDVLLALFRLAHLLGIDLPMAAAKKHRTNIMRPYLHGKPS